MADKIISVSILAVLALCIHSCAEKGREAPRAVFKQVPEIGEIRPRKPVRIKLRKNASGSYSWELTGDDTGKIIEADRRLKESLSD